jgi:hypothetical protein
MYAGERRFMKTNANSTATALEATDKDCERMPARQAKNLRIIRNIENQEAARITREYYL